MTGRSLLGRTDRTDRTVRVALGSAPPAALPEDLRRQLPGLLGGGTDTLVIDVSGVDRLSSACVATLLGVKRSCHARRIRVVLAAPSDRTREVLNRTGLASVFEIER